MNEHIPSGRPVNSFISQVFLSSPPSPERFVLNREPYEKYIAENTTVPESTGKGKKKYKKVVQQQQEEAAEPAETDEDDEGEKAASSV